MCVYLLSTQQSAVWIPGILAASLPTPSLIWQPRTVRGNLGIGVSLFINLIHPGTRGLLPPLQPHFPFLPLWKANDEETRRAGEGEGVLVANRQSPWTVRLPTRHRPIDTSLCGRWAQVRIYGFVATGFSIFSCGRGAGLSEDKMLKPLVQQKSLSLGHLVQRQIMLLGHFLSKIKRVSFNLLSKGDLRKVSCFIWPTSWLFMHLMQWALCEPHFIRILISLASTAFSMANKQNETDPKREKEYLDSR